MRKISYKFKLFIYEYIRKFLRSNYLKDITNKIGKVVIEDDKIVCYVDQKMLDRYKGDYPIYNLSLNGINVNSYNEKFVKNLKLNKRVYYVFDGIEFYPGLEMSSFCANVTFKNCTFNKNIGIFWGENITFENNKYIDSCDVYYYGKCFLTAHNVNKLTFINDKFINNYSKQFGKVNFGMRIDANLVEFINMHMSNECTSILEIKADKTKIENSALGANEVYIDTKTIQTTDDSLITANNGVIIENENYDFKGGIDSPVIIYNGTDISKAVDKDEKINIDMIEMIESRQNLVNFLNNLKDYCVTLNNDRTVNDTVNSENVLVKK